jgi:methylase of polypeptide subunit release factors
VACSPEGARSPLTQRRALLGSPPVAAAKCEALRLPSCETRAISSARDVCETVATTESLASAARETHAKRTPIRFRWRIVNRAESWEARLRVVHHRYVLPWDHNVYYHRLLLRAAPAGANTVLDVGCGAGQLATKLAVRARRVDALDRDPAMIELPRVRAPSNVGLSAGRCDGYGPAGWALRRHRVDE